MLEKTFIGLQDIKDFYSNGEIIKYDAVQFNVTLGLWYKIQSDGSLDDSSPEIVLPGRRAPINFIDDLEKQVANRGITEAEKTKKLKNGEVLIDKAVVMFGLVIIKNIKIILNHYHLMERYINRINKNLHGSIL